MQSAPIQSLVHGEQQQFVVATLASELRKALIVLEEKLACLCVVLLPMNDGERENAVQFQQRVHNRLHDLHLGDRVHAVVSAHVLPLQLRFG